METVSIIVPAYNGADLLGQTIESVLAQTYPHLELIVVNDASPDHTEEVVRRYSDPRVRYIRHEQNQGANQAWLTGLRAATGAFVACLDQDDLFHPEKLQEHMKLYQEHPAAGFSYNGRFELLSSDESVRGIWQSPPTVTLADLVLGFPFAPSDMIIRREWALMDGLWEDNDSVHGNETLVNGAEYVYCGRLYYAGCQFAGIPRPLNYRRYHAGRVLSKLAARCRSEIRCQAIVLDDPRCPPEVQALRPQAYRNTYLGFASLAFTQREFALGYEYLQSAAQWDPAILQGTPAPLVQAIVTRAIPGDTQQIEALLREVFANLPADLAGLRSQLDWAVGRSHLLHGAKALLWGQKSEGAYHLKRAIALKATLDEDFQHELAHQLAVFEGEFGKSASKAVLRTWQPYLIQLDSGRAFHQMVASYLANRAFHRFRSGDYANVPASVLQAMWRDPRYIFNRGMVSIMAKSIYALPGKRPAAA